LYSAVKIPSTKHQITNKFKYLNSKLGIYDSTEY
jgi:hypothetical protein